MKPHWPIVLYLLITLLWGGWVFDYYRLPTIVEAWQRRTGLYIEAASGEDITDKLEAALQRIDRFPWWRARIVILPQGDFVVSGSLEPFSIIGYGSGTTWVRRMDLEERP